MANIINYSKVNEHPDHVACTFCGAEMYVDCDTYICPHCGHNGTLVDIEQEVD